MACPDCGHDREKHLDGIDPYHHVVCCVKNFLGEFVCGCVRLRKDIPVPSEQEMERPMEFDDQVRLATLAMRLEAPSQYGIDFLVELLYDAGIEPSQPAVEVARGRPVGAAPPNQERDR